MPYTEPHFSEPPTQVEHPARAAWRTGLSTALSVVLTLGLVLPVVVSIVNAELGAYLPDAWEAWLVGAGALVTALAAAVNRIMLIPAVNAWLTKHGIGPKPAEKE